MKEKDKELEWLCESLHQELDVARTRPRAESAGFPFAPRRSVFGELPTPRTATTLVRELAARPRGTEAVLFVMPEEQRARTVAEMRRAVTEAGGEEEEPGCRWRLPNGVAVCLPSPSSELRGTAPWRVNRASERFHRIFDDFIFDDSRKTQVKVPAGMTSRFVTSSPALWESSRIGVLPASEYEWSSLYQGPPDAGTRATSSSCEPLTFLKLKSFLDSLPPRPPETVVYLSSYAKQGHPVELPEVRERGTGRRLKPFFMHLDDEAFFRAEFARRGLTPPPFIRPGEGGPKWDWEAADTPAEEEASKEGGPTYPWAVLMGVKAE